MRKLRVVAILLSLFGLVGCATVPQLAPISGSGQWLPGTFVWRDLVTAAPDLSRKFYADLFGWEFEQVANTGYYLIRSAGEPIGGLADANRLARIPDRAVWLCAISVASVDGSAQRIADAGGKVLQAPTDVPGRGRMAVVQDPFGAILRLMRTERGDPPDHEPGTNQWLWMELIADDPAAAAAFYQATLGYEVATRAEVGGAAYYALKQSGLERARILAKPFEKTRPAWIPSIRVASAKDASARAVQMGGKLVVAPGEAYRQGQVALVLDPAGAPLVLQEWDPKTDPGIAP